MPNDDFPGVSRPTTDGTITPLGVAEELFYAAVIASMLPAFMAKLLLAFLPVGSMPVATGIAFAASGFTGVIFSARGLRAADDGRNGFRPRDVYALMGRSFASWSALFAGCTTLTVRAILLTPLAASTAYSVMLIVIMVLFSYVFLCRVERMTARQSVKTADIHSTFVQRHAEWAQVFLLFAVIVTYVAPAVACLFLALPL